MLANEKYVIRFSILNPPYQASKNFLLWVDSVGSTYDMANIINPAVTTNPITITEE